ncbi:hypothetical protein F2Q68_00011464 [Brassica cretica]|uniref:ATPase AAA-type core domain-containing protein n=1 Tax=Brassica cretica TaxID=69181 RepID=A0A8S9KT90_BRACR|nr:hypothetical protein F2Q68_00011464 [Brassica cretica]
MSSRTQLHICSLLVPFIHNLQFSQEPESMLNEGSTVLALLDLLHSLVLGTPWGEARIIVIFTTNNKDMLDPTLLSRISVDIYMGHCCFEGFKVLASNYWASLMTMMMSHTVSIQTSSV